MNNQLPKISIVVPSYNQGIFLEHALESIFSQEYPKLEVIVMDGGSSDKSLEIIQVYQKKLTYWQSKPDGGQASAINAGMQHCTGDIVAWLNSDDWYVNDPFWTVAHAYQENPGSGLFIGNGFRFKDAEYKPFCPRHIAISREVLREGLDYILQPATFMLHEAWLQSGGLNVNLHYGLDWDLFIRILEKQSAVAINEFLAVSREYEQTKTASGQLIRAKELLGIAAQSTSNMVTSSLARYLMNDAIYEFLALLGKQDGIWTSSGLLSLRQELLDIVSQNTHNTVTLGSAYYLLETLLGINLKESTYGDEARKFVYLTMQRLQQQMKARWGTSDPFPIQSDEQDKVFISFARETNSKTILRHDVQTPPKISIVIPSYNQAEFLSKTLDSIVRQNYPALEIIVFDGGSTDGSVEIIKKYSSHLTYWQSETDLGPAHAINKGFAKATGDIIGWLNSDDVLTDGALWHIAAEFTQDPRTDVVFGNSLYIDERDQLFLADHGTHRTGLYYGKLEPMSNVPYYWTYVYAIPQPTVYFRRQLLDKVGGVDQAYHFIFDFEFFWRLRKVADFKKIEKTLALYRVHSRSKTSNWNKFLGELFRFSRPLWPQKDTAEYKTAFSSLINHYFPHRSYLVRQIAKIVVSYQITSPEKLEIPSFLKKYISYAVQLLRDFLRRYRPQNIYHKILKTLNRKNKAVEPKSSHHHLPNISSRAESMYTVSEEGKKYTIAFCGLQYPMHPGHSGGEIRDFHILRKLLGIAQIDFFALGNSPAKNRRDDLRPFFRTLFEPETLYSNLSHQIDHSAFKLDIKTRWLLRLRSRNIPVVGPIYHHDSFGFVFPNRAYVLPLLNKFIKAMEPDFLIIGPQVNPLPLQIPFVPEKTRLILSSYDVEAVRMERIAASQKGLAHMAMQLEVPRARTFEHDTLEKYDGIIAVSETDKQSYVQRYQFEPERILVLDNSVDTEYFSFRPRAHADQPNIIFVASLGYWPNDEAAQRLLGEIMPLVRQHVPNARAWIVGQSPSRKLLDLSNDSLNIVTGQVDDVRPFLDMASVTCIPLRTGSGTKYKVLEAASAGVPIVCTPLALEGLSLRVDDHVLVGQSDQELADALIQTIQNPTSRSQAVQSAAVHVEEHYSWNSNLNKLDPWLEAMQKMPKHRK